MSLLQVSNQLAMESVRKHLKTISLLPAKLAQGVEKDLLRQITSVRPTPKSKFSFLCRHVWVCCGNFRFENLKLKDKINLDSFIWLHSPV